MSLFSIDHSKLKSVQVSAIFYCFFIFDITNIILVSCGKVLQTFNIVGSGASYGIHTQFIAQGLQQWKEDWVATRGRYSFCHVLFCNASTSISECCLKGNNSQPNIYSIHKTQSCCCSLLGY